jgi:hypothetical protein
MRPPRVCFSGAVLEVLAADGWEVSHRGTEARSPRVAFGRDACKGKEARKEGRKEGRKEAGTSALRHRLFDLSISSLSFLSLSFFSFLLFSRLLPSEAFPRA